MEFLCVSLKKNHCFFLFLCCVFIPLSLGRVGKKILYNEFCSIGFYQFLKVVTPVHRYCSVNVLRLNSTIKKMTNKRPSKRVIYIKFLTIFYENVKCSQFYDFFVVANKRRNRILLCVMITKFQHSTVHVLTCTKRSRNDPVL